MKAFSIALIFCLISSSANAQNESTSPVAPQPKARSARPDPQSEPGNRPGPSTSAPVSDARPTDVRKTTPVKRARGSQATKPARKAALPERTKTKIAKPAAAAASGDILSEASRAAARTGTGATIAEIKIEGTKKIEVDAVLARLQSKIGGKLDLAVVRQDVDALFKTGFFYDVQIARNDIAGGVQVVYRVIEKPSITEITFEGNDDLEDDELSETTGIKAFEILNMAKIKEATEKIQKQYEEKGFFLARITPVVVPIAESDSVRVVFQIQENEKVKVKRITFLGNSKLGDNRLKGVMQTQEGGFFSFISDSGAYKQDVFDRDVQLLNYIYFNEGYVTAKVDRPQVYITPDKKGIYITVRIEEGERYKVGQIDFAGDLLFDNDDLMKSVDIDGSGWYVHETLLKDIRTLQAKYGDLGYAYTNVIPRVRNRDADREVDITFEIDKGNKIYFGRINVSGNSKTRDKVLRRELKIREGELYNETRRRESLANVQRLGYFDEVNFNSSTPSDNPDLMNLDIVVKERNTGTIQVGAGYSTYSKFIFQGQVNQINLFGKGQKLGISVDLSSNQSLFNLNFTEPYFYDSEWSVGFDAYQSRRGTPEYTEKKTGGALRVGHPLAPYLNGYIRYKLDDTEIDLGTDGDNQLFPVETANGITSSTTFTIEYDKRNDRFSPTDGVYSSLSAEYAGIGGGKAYTIGRGTARFYKKVFWEFVFRNNLTYSFIRSNKEGIEPPFNELFLLGGANSLRGYDWYSVGKRRRSQKVYDAYRTANPTAPLEKAEEAALRPFGGEQQIYYQAEMEFPLITEAGIKGVFFFDVGDAQDALAFDALRADVGFGFRWFSPIGPLRFEWGFPVGRRANEPSNNFQFAVGAPF